MIGALVAFGVGGGLALIAVLAYRLLAFWLPSIPGVIAYFQLRRTVGHWEQHGEGRSEIGSGRRSPPRDPGSARQRERFLGRSARKTLGSRVSAKRSTISMEGASRASDR